MEHMGEIIRGAVTGCYGVAGMGRKCLPRVYRDGKDLTMDLHILIAHGMNLSVIIRSVTSKVCI